MGETALDRLIRGVSPYLDALLDLVYPRHCAGCGQPGEVFCLNCQSRLHPFKPFRCQSCGRKLHGKGIYCGSCRAAESGIPVASFAAYRAPLKGALLSLKYRPDRKLAQLMSAWLAARWRMSGWPASLVIPVPLSAERQKDRGFNQAELIAAGLAQRLNLPCATALQRTRDTGSQVGLSQRQRHRNVLGAFKANADLVRGQQVVLVDDLVTTGATMHACAQALKGAGHIVGLTVAKA